MPFCHVMLKAKRPQSSKYPQQLSTLGDRIRRRRLDLGLFQKQVAEQVGVDEETIFRWESNESGPQIQFIPAIIKLLGYTRFRFRNDYRKS